MWINSLLLPRTRDLGRHQDKGRSLRHPLAHRRSSRPRIEVLENRALLSLLVTSNADSGLGSLRAAIAAAPSGAVIKFAKGVHNITLTSGQLQVTQSLDIEGPGANRLIISGNNTSRIFDIENAPNVVIAGLTITNGRADGNAVNHPSIGGGIYHISGTLTLSRVVVSGNLAVGDFKVNDPTFPGHNGGAFAGGIFNQDGTLNIVHSALINDRAVGADGGVGAVNTDCGDAEGGCINNSSVNASAYLTVSDTVFIGNQAIAGNGGAGSVDANPGFFGVVDLAVGGAIMNFYFAFLPSPQPVVTSVASLTNCTFIGNEAIGGNNAKGGNAFRDIVGVGEGGAVSNDFNCSTVMNHCSLIGNQAIGGSGGTPGTGMSQQVDVGEGAGIGNLGTIFVNRTTFSNNIAQGGAGSDGLGGGIASILGVGNGTVIKSVFVHNFALGGTGGNGQGGGLYVGMGDTMTLIADTLTQNFAIGSSPGQGVGGGIFSAGTLTLIGTKPKHNHASSSNNDIFS